MLRLVSRASRSRFAAIVPVVFLTATLAPAAQLRLAERSSTHAPPVLMRDEREGGEYERNERWFYEQRAYPFGTIPPDARRKAWEQWKRVERRTAATRDAARPAAMAGAPVPVWRQIGPAPTRAFFDEISPVSGRLRAVAVSPADPQLILVGGTVGGIWRSADGGATFAPVSDDQVDLAVGAIAFAPSDPNVVYAAMGQAYFGSGVLRSTDAGRTWRRVSDTSLPTPAEAADVLVDPSNPNRVYVAQYAGFNADGSLTSSGFYVSTDGGARWTRTFTGLARDLAIDAGDPHTIYLAMDRVDEAAGGPEGVYRSTDSGLTWSPAYAGPFAPGNYNRFFVAASPADPNRVYALGTGSLGGGLAYRVATSADRGAHWSDVTSTGLQSDRPVFLVASPFDAGTLYAGYPGGDLFKTTDGGQHWSCVTMGYCDGQVGRDDLTHVDQHAFAFSPADGERVYLGNDGGLYTSSDGGRHWASLNQTLSLVTFRTIAIHPANVSLSFGGTQDNGTQRRENGTSGWSEGITGDGGGVVVDATDSGVIFTTYIYGTIFRWTRDMSIFDKQVADDSTFGEASSGRIAFYPPFVGDGATGRLYFGTWRLFTSDDRGETWRAPAGQVDLTSGGRDVLSAIAVAPSDPNVIYTGSSEGRAMVTSDGGRTWRDVTAGLPDRFITAVAVDRANPSVAWLTVSGYHSGHVFKTTNMGAAWADVSGELPDIPANALLQDPLDPNTVYLGTDIGAFRSTSGGAAWEGFTSGMPPAPVLAFASHPSGAVQAATYGRGAYELGERASTDPDFGIAFAPSTVTIPRGGQLTVTIHLRRSNGFLDGVTITLPSVQGIKVKALRGAIPSPAAEYKIKVKRSVAPGDYALSFSARSTSGQVRNTTLTVTVR
jgi:photosystem II stability/assembly factor-like uncharacterized protein